MPINKERLAEQFTTLCEIDSPSRQEAMVADYLYNQFESLGADFITTDDSAAQTGSNTNNLIVRFDGNRSHKDSVFFACHMDTVNPGSGIKVVRKGDMFSSKNDTILGGDDKSGIAILLELISLLNEQSIPHRPIELVFTTCEEIGLLGAKALDHSILQSKYGYALDSSYMGKVITGAPAANSLTITIKGFAAHSGLAPESGINALAIAADAISKIKLGRLDDLTTANLGLIQGGTATNIVPDFVQIKGEVRSHSQKLLVQHTEQIVQTFREVTEGWPPCGDGSDKKPSVNFAITEDFPPMSLDKNDTVLKHVNETAAKLDRKFDSEIAGGGSDANIFNSYGLKTAILPTGMTNVHTIDETIDLNDMVKQIELLLAMVRVDQ